MAAFENEGFDADLAEQEVKRQRENEEEAEASQAAERKVALERKAKEDAEAKQAREKQLAELAQKEKVRSRLFLRAYPHRQIVSVG